MNQFLLVCSDQNENAEMLLSKLRTSNKWELTLDAANIAPGSSSDTFRIKSNFSLAEVESELFSLFKKDLFMVAPL